jgi:hypothetical protein
VTLTTDDARAVGVKSRGRVRLQRCRVELPGDDVAALDLGLLGQRFRRLLAPGWETSPENAKTPPERGFLRCAAEDSNLHPVIRTRPSGTP